MPSRLGVPGAGRTRRAAGRQRSCGCDPTRRGEGRRRGPPISPRTGAQTPAPLRRRRRAGRRRRTDRQSGRGLEAPGRGSRAVAGPSGRPPGPLRTARVATSLSPDMAPRDRSSHCCLGGKSLRQYESGARGARSKRPRIRQKSRRTASSVSGRGCRSARSCALARTRV